MKFLGQHIQSLIARFRASVYLENVPNSLDSVEKYLMVESDGKIGYKEVKTYNSTVKYADNTVKAGLVPTASAAESLVGKFLKVDGSWQFPAYYVGGTGIGISGNSISLDISDVIASDVANRVLTTDGDGSLSAETNMTFDGATLVLGGSIEQDTVIELNNDDNQVNLGISDGTNSIAIGDADGDFVINSTGAHNLVFATSNFERFKIESGGGCTVANNLTTGGIVLDGNTITGVDDSGEFTNDDAHIMTSAAVEDKILGYNFLTSVPNHSGDLITSGTVAAARVATLNQDTTGTAAGLSATLNVASGGTGATTFASNSLLTGNSGSAIQAEADLTFSSSTLFIGDDDVGSYYIRRRSHSDGAGAALQVLAAEGGGTNASGGILALYGGASTGTGSGGNIRLYTCPPTADSDADVNPHVLQMSIEADGSVDFKNNVVSDFHRKLTPTSTSTSGDADGDVVYFGNGPSGGDTTAGLIYCYKSTGNWELADADSADYASGFLAVAISTSPSTHGMLIRGMVTHHVELEGTEAKGSIVYLSATDGGVATVDPPTGSGDVIRVLGYALDTDNDQLYFNPSMDWIEIA
tara:strand:+ start:180 stop:1928 length:1749 start_codon:yes stop_codon:yes gene_type:complete